VVRSTRQAGAARSEFAGFRFPPEVITLAVRWYVRCALSYRDVEELLAERGIEVDHTTLFRYAVHPAVHRGGPAPPAHPRRSLVY
jgi:transposase, IS6 family